MNILFESFKVLQYILFFGVGIYIGVLYFAPEYDAQSAVILWGLALIVQSNLPYTNWKNYFMQHPVQAMVLALAIELAVLATVVYLPFSDL